MTRSARAHDLHAALGLSTRCPLDSTKSCGLWQSSGYKLEATHGRPWIAWDEQLKRDHDLDGMGPSGLRPGGWSCSKLVTI